MAGDVEQHHLLDELLLGEAVALVLGRDQRGEQVVARVLRASTRSSRRCSATMLSPASNARERLLAGEDRVERLHDRARPLAQLRAVAAVGDAEHLGDHDERQREREVGDEVHLAGAARVDRVEVLVDELLRPAAAAPRSCAA